MKLDDLPVVLAVQERDIDLLLLEELHATPAFATWFAEQLGLTGASFDGAWHSVSNANGETDVLLRVRIGEERVGILIEDKIAAGEQHEQDVRYHRRGAEGIKADWFSRYLTCMVAPQAYLAGLADDSRYDGRIPYATRHHSRPRSRRSMKSSRRCCGWCRMRGISREPATRSGLGAIRDRVALACAGSFLRSRTPGRSL